MSMQGGIGAACAAIEIIALINTELVKKTKPEIIIQRVKLKAETIKELGESGWY